MDKKPSQKPQLSVEHQFLADNVRRVRVLRGMSNRVELALAADVPLEAVDFTEKGPQTGKEIPSIDDLRKIIRFLDYEEVHEALLMNVAERILAGEKVFELHSPTTHETIGKS